MSDTHTTLMNLRLPSGIQKIDHVLEGYQSFQVLLSALDLGVFEFLDKQGPSDRNAIAQGIGMNGMFSRDFLGTLADLGFVSRHGEKFANTKVAMDFLPTRSPFFQGDWIRNTAKSSHWSDLTASLTREEPSSGNGGKPGPSAAFINALGQKALRGELQTVTEAISSWNGFFGAKRMLDVGGGHGLYTIALCQAHPQLRGVVLDQPHVIETTLSYINDYQMQDRISAMAGDIHGGNVGCGYDIVLISHLLYKFRRNLEPIFDTLHDCLNPGGLLVTNHWFCATGCIAESSGVQELAKALQSFGHPLCHVEDFDNLFHQKGFNILATTVAPTTFGPTRLQLAEKHGQAQPCNCQEGRCCCG